MALRYCVHNFGAYKDGLYRLEKLGTTLDEEMILAKEFPEYYEQIRFDLNCIEGILNRASEIYTGTFEWNSNLGVCMCDFAVATG